MDKKLKNMILTDILQNVVLLKTIGNKEIDIQNIQFDSRNVEAGSVFVATRGVTSDGHLFIPMAIEKGALAIVCEEIPTQTDSNITYIKVANSSDALGKMASAWYGFPSSKMILVGVTGTNGKTTIVTLLYQLFRQLGHKAGLLSTVCNYVNDVPVEATHTTPDAMELNELLAQMVSVGCEYAFMEVSSHSIDQRRIAGLEFNGGIFTNITRL
jgi:UDP-N-acetylmuramoyl-L-alanyl-D-glutamate--2,6-diaminopimelate ligase